MEGLPVIVVHGGAWAIPDDLASASKNGVKNAALEGYWILKKGGSSLDAVQKAVEVLEDDPAFDAGTGSVLNADGQVEMDAIVMRGSDRRSGSVACVGGIRHPVRLARHVLEDTQETMLVGAAAGRLADSLALERRTTEQLVTPHARREWEEYRRYRSTVSGLFAGRGHDTVGAVAVDAAGRLACATSTGGITAKLAGRVGDSPVPGSGAYCDDAAGACSTTGHGEALLRLCLAHGVCRRMKRGASAAEACRAAVQELGRRTGGHGGAVAVSRSGQLGVSFSTARMAWAAVTPRYCRAGLEPGEEESEPTPDVTSPLTSDRHRCRAGLESEPTPDVTSPH